MPFSASFLTWIFQFVAVDGIEGEAGLDAGDGEADGDGAVADGHGQLAQPGPDELHRPLALDEVEDVRVRIDYGC